MGEAAVQFARHHRVPYKTRRTQTVCPMFHLRRRRICSISRPQAPKTLEAAVRPNSTSTSFFGYCKLFQ
jgi:hypothetical protein